MVAWVVNSRFLSARSFLCYRSEIHDRACSPPSIFYKKATGMGRGQSLQPMVTPPLPLSLLAATHKRHLVCVADTGLTGTDKSAKSFSYNTYEKRGGWGRVMVNQNGVLTNPSSRGTGHGPTGHSYLIASPLFVRRGHWESARGSSWYRFL